jgi:hypothetical protein
LRAGSGERTSSFMSLNSDAFLFDPGLATGFVEGSSPRSSSLSMITPPRTPFLMVLTMLFACEETCGCGTDGLDAGSYNSCGTSGGFSGSACVSILEGVNGDVEMSIGVGDGITGRDLDANDKDTGMSYRTLRPQLWPDANQLRGDNKRKDTLEEVGELAG